MPFVAVVIPAYRESARLPALLEDLLREAKVAPTPAAEFIVVDDGSDGAETERERVATLELARRFKEEGSPHLARFVALPRNRGKGAAVRAGWHEADPSAIWLGLLDADGAVSAREAWRLIRTLERTKDVDVLAGSRLLMAGRHIQRRFLRHLQGRIFATLVENAFHLGFYDTQCGLKFFRGCLLRPLLGALREERWLLDVEVLALLSWGGARCREEPIDWCDPGGSKMIFCLDALRMITGLWRLRLRIGQH
ncbi:MAG TPA: glycosyltransferase [Anaeromyxobacteraceae bacterium]|nr:glycosyltransferase [Anaeromyxobacteraceae bacterium]